MIVCIKLPALRLHASKGTTSHASGLVGSIEVPQDSVLGSFWQTLARVLKSISTIQLEGINAETRAFDDILKDYAAVSESAQVGSHVVPVS